MSTRKTVGILAMIPVMMVACTEGDTPAAPDVALTAAADHTFFEFVQHFFVCKEGTDADFEYEVVDAGTGNILDAGTFSVMDGSCYEVGFWDGGDPIKEFTVTELAGPYVFLSSSLQRYAGLDVPIGSPVVGAETVTARIGIDLGVVVTYYNDPPPMGGEGCTPGYWKQEHHFDSWMGYMPDMLFGDVFEDAFPGMTLVDVLGQGGGGLYALGRHTVAALLNASSMYVSYDLTVMDVMNAFNAVYPGTKDDYNMLKDMFEGYNEQGCPLN